MHTELTAWLFRPYPETFPYAAVVEEFQRVGKHFVGEELLALLDRARRKLPAGFDADADFLARFLDFTLDKHDGRYDNPSYIAVDLLPLAERDRLVAILVADVLRHELEHGNDARLVAKRCRLGLRVLQRGDDPYEAIAAVEREFSDAEAHRVRRLTVLPVSLVHDEYMFIRLLQCYEATFAFIAAKLREAIAGAGAPAIRAAERALLDARPLWSMVATMRPGHFLAFREFTDGASAIQSRNYKLVESLCSRPSDARLDSPAYRSVPEVRERVLAGQPALDEGEHDAAARKAMDAFESALAHWRNSHYKLAVKMLGSRRGTGYTEGVPYLHDVRALPVFAKAA
jgi:tryptophan 2,3-dioxygenase